MITVLHRCKLAMQTSTH